MLYAMLNIWMLSLCIMVVAVLILSQYIRYPRHFNSFLIAFSENSIEFILLLTYVYAFWILDFSRIDVCMCVCSFFIFSFVRILNVYLHRHWLGFSNGNRFTKALFIWEKHFGIKSIQFSRFFFYFCYCLCLSGISV